MSQVITADTSQGLSSKSYSYPFAFFIDRVARLLLFISALSSIFITFGIVYILVSEGIVFFEHVSIVEFLLGTVWTPMFANPEYGILPLLSGTLVTTFIAILVALPVGSIIALWMSEFASPKLREILKPVLELISAVPTVIFGYFALMVIAPLLQSVLPDLPTFNMLSAGIVMGIMITPYVSSLSEDALRAVPMLYREGSMALGANKIETALKVVYPAAFSGIVSSYILAISRAIGETMIVAIAAGMQPNFTFDPTQAAATLTAFIVQVSLGDLPHGTIGYQSIFAVGLFLFCITLTLNIIGALLRTRFREVY